MMRLLKFGVYGGCMVFLISLAFGLYIDYCTAILLPLTGAAVAGLSLSGIIIWFFVRRPSLSKLRTVLLPVVVIALTIASSGMSSFLSWKLFLWPRQQEMNSFTRDLIEYGRIKELSDGLRYYKTVNADLFDSSHDKLVPANHSGLLKLLEKHDIELSRYTEFRERLISLGFIDVEVTDNYVAFLHDGIIDNLYGVLWVKPGTEPPPVLEPPEIRPLLFGCPLVSLRELGEGWYIFATS